MTEQSDKPGVDGLTLAALTKAERALWVLREHNHIHFGHDHSTVAEAQAAWILVRERLAALAGPLEQPQEPTSDQANLAQASGVCDLQTALPEGPLRVGDYVLATKYDDGDPGDMWALGFYDGVRDDQGRHYVKDGDGKQIRGNGFRRVARIRGDVGRWLLEVAATQLERCPAGTVNLWTMLTDKAFDCEVEPIAGPLSRVGQDPPPALPENPQVVWRAIGEEAECVVQGGRKYLLLSEEMCVRLGGALGM